MGCKHAGFWPMALMPAELIPPMPLQLGGVGEAEGGKIT